jgi:hypothetical protein
VIVIAVAFDSHRAALLFLSGRKGICVGEGSEVAGETIESLNTGNTGNRDFPMRR